MHTSTDFEANWSIYPKKPRDAHTIQRFLTQRAMGDLGKQLLSLHFGPKVRSVLTNDVKKKATLYTQDNVQLNKNGDAFRGVGKTQITLKQLEDVCDRYKDGKVKTGVTEAYLKELLSPENPVRTFGAFIKVGTSVDSFGLAQIKYGSLYIAAICAAPHRTVKSGPFVILRELERFGRENGVKTISLHASTEASKNIYLKERWGFYLTDPATKKITNNLEQTKLFADDGDFVGFFMTKPLDPVKLNQGEENTPTNIPIKKKKTQYPGFSSS